MRMLNRCSYHPGPHWGHASCDILLNFKWLYSYKPASIVHSRLAEEWAGGRWSDSAAGSRTTCQVSEFVVLIMVTFAFFLQGLSFWLMQSSSCNQCLLVFCTHQPLGFFHSFYLTSVSSGKSGYIVNKKAKRSSGLICEITGVWETCSQSGRENWSGTVFSGTSCVLSSSLGESRRRGGLFSVGWILRLLMKHSTL